MVFLRVNAKQVMALSDAIPDIPFKGKPECHIIAIAKEQQRVAVSVGCMLSRVRTGMPNTEMTAAVPARHLQEVVNRLRSASRRLPGRGAGASSTVIGAVEGAARLLDSPGASHVARPPRVWRSRTRLSKRSRAAKAAVCMASSNDWIKRQSHTGKLRDAHFFPIVESEKVNAIDDRVIPGVPQRLWREI